MEPESQLKMIKRDTIQKVYQALSQAVGEDYQEADARLELITHNSKPSLIWDFIHRNLIKSFPQKDILHSTQKRGPWEILLLYDPESKLLLSFMNEKRFKFIRDAGDDSRPLYIRALLLLNGELQGVAKQQFLFQTEFEKSPDRIKELLNNLCMTFFDPTKQEIEHHVLVVFSTSYSIITSLNAYILDRDLDIVADGNWLNLCRPAITSVADSVEKDHLRRQQHGPKLAEKAKRRLLKKREMALKNNESEKQRGVAE